jgi:hypothetical protein
VIFRGHRALTPKEQNENIPPLVNTEPAMSQSVAPNPQADGEWLEAAADQAIAACGGDAREAVKALIVATEFLEAEVSCGYVRGYRHGRFKTYSG